MRIGYPCINFTIGCRGNRTFRLKSYSDEHLIETAESNLECLFQMLKYNVKHKILLFRISSDLIPFASHPVCSFNWQDHFKSTFHEIGLFIKKHGIRISMHPHQFTLINAEKETIFRRSQAELFYHVQIINLLGLDDTAKIQIHVGGLYKNRQTSLRRFIRRYHQIDTCLKKYLVIENDDYNFSLEDCMHIHQETGIPVLLDVFHHAINNHKETIHDALGAVEKTWRNNDGPMLLDYTSQQPGARRGTHSMCLDEVEFKEFIEASQPYDFDLMLEIKDKECSAIKAVSIVINDTRFVGQVLEKMR